jgi:hypothetical protein
MRVRTIVILLLLVSVVISSSGCISIPAMPKIQPIQAPVQKPPNAFVEVKDINYNPSANISVNVTVTPTPTPTPTSRFIYV